MKTKIFLQHNPIWLLLQVVFLIAPIVCLVEFIQMCKDANEFPTKYLVLLLCIVIIIGIIIFVFEKKKNRIVFRNDKCNVPKEWTGKSSRVQYKTEIFYDEIVDLHLILSTNNSLNEPLTSMLPNASVTKPYLEFTCKDGTKKRIFVMYFTENQKRKIIDEFKLRMKAVGNDAELEDTKDIIAKQGKIMIEI